MKLKKNDLIWSMVYAIFCIYVVSHLYMYITSNADQIIVSTTDDAYFYFKIASTFVNTGLISFDEIHPTNGFHPLWFLVLTLIFKVTDDKILALRFVGIFTTFLMMISIYFALKYLKKHYSLIAMLISSLGILFYSSQLFNTKMEVAIVIPLCILILYLTDKTEFWNLDNAKYSDLLVIGFLMSLAQMARLDAILFNITILSILIWKNKKTFYAKRNHIRIISLLLFPFITGVSYISINYHFFHHITPISSTVKSLETNGFNEILLHQLSAPFITLFRGSDPYYSGSSILLVFSLVYIIWDITKNNKNDKNWVALSAVIFYIVQICYYLFFTSADMPPWYWYAPLLVVIFTIPVFVDKIIEKIKIFTPLEYRKIVIHSMIIVLLLLTPIFASINTPFTDDSTTIENSSRYRSYLMANYVNHNIPEESILAMGDGAGSFGYFSNNRVIHLEGLVNDYGVIEPLKSNKLDEYMSEENVEYFVYEGDDIPDSSNKDYSVAVVHPTDNVTIETDIIVYKKDEVYSDVKAKNKFIWQWKK